MTSEELLAAFAVVAGELATARGLGAAYTVQGDFDKARAAVLARMVSPGHVRFPETHQEAVAMVAICERMFPDSVPRMNGPGEVVVPKEPTDKMIDAAIKTAEHVADRDGEMYPLYSVSEVYAAMLAARPNNGGTDGRAG